MDEPASRTPPFLGYFDVSNVGFAWKEPRPEQIERRRAAMGDVLIFDILLKSGGIRQPETLFPPTNVEHLLRLLDAIEASHYDTLKKECLIYFLLKWHHDGREDKFQVERSLPPQFTALADAYWYLDTGINIARAVSILSDVRLDTDHASKIIHAISLSPDPAPLIIKYVRTAKPPLVEPIDIDVYALALAESNFLEAWLFQRTFNETDLTRPRLLEKLLEWCISPDPRRGPLAAMLGFPLSPFEEKFLHNYALEPPKSLSKSSIAVLRDLICVRLIQSSKYAEAIKIDHQFASSTLNESKTASQDRGRMIQEIYDALPSVDRALLDSELEGLTHSKSKITVNGVSATGVSNSGEDDVGMSQSWEDISRSFTQHPPSTGLPNRDVVPLPERSGAPRFGGPIPNASTSTPAAPIIPISTPPASGSISAPRRSFPLAPAPLSSLPLLSSRPHQSLTRDPAPLSLGANTSTLSSGGLKFPPPISQSLMASTSGGSEFSPASRKQNAFYKPPPLKAGSINKTPNVEREPATTDDVDDPEGDQSMAMGVDMAKEDLDRDNSPIAIENQARDVDEGNEFGFSVFGNGPIEQSQRMDIVGTSSTVKRSGDAVMQEMPTRKVPPGAFLSEEEEGGSADESHERARDLTPSPPRSRSTREVKPVVQSRNTRRSRPKDVDLGRSLPGSLMDDDDDEADDYVAPLRSPSPPRRPQRKVRSSTPSEMDDDTGDGVQTRRRSSRLSTTGSAHAASPEQKSPPKRTGAKARKSARVSASGASKKKR